MKFYDRMIEINIDDIDPVDLEDNDEFIPLLSTLKSAVTLSEKQQAFNDLVEYIDDWFNMYNEYKDMEDKGDLDEEYHSKDSKFLQFLNANGIYEEDIKNMMAN